MTNLLMLKTSLSGDAAHSNTLMSEFLGALADNGELTTKVRDLSQEDLPHLNADEMAAWMVPAEERSESQQLLASLSDTLLTELEQADTLLVGMPMYNFGVPSVFKAWIDRVARAGRSFKYTENGPQGLLSGKKVIVFATRGGMYAGTPLDTQTQYLKDVFAFLGMTDVGFVYAEGLAMGDAAATNALDGAKQKINELIPGIAA